jgi:SAM-dependent methyltransferase
MTKSEKLIPPLVLKYLSPMEREYLEDIFENFDGFPELEQLWSLMDEPWVNLGCDPLNMDDRVTSYYQHPVWLLNGLFIEQDMQSLQHRRDFLRWVVDKNPTRVADFGCGFGGLARLIGKALPDTIIEAVEPHPHPAAIALAADTPNVRFVAKLSGKYDILISTDVFEHVPDPIGLTAETAEYLRIGGQYLIANCFAPVILCHLPQLFHLNVSWDAVMQAMGLEPQEKVAYGRSYLRRGDLSVRAALKRDQCGRTIYPLVAWLPRGQARVGKILMEVFCR